MTASPILQALLVADHVYQDKNTGKMIICGVFHNIRFWDKDAVKVSVEEDPDGTKHKVVPIQDLHSAGSPYCYINLTEVMGTKKFELRFVDLKTNEAIFGTEFEITSEDPLKVIEGFMPLPKLEPRRAGICSLELLCDNELLGSHRIKVTPRETEEQE